MHVLRMPSTIKEEEENGDCQISTATTIPIEEKLIPVPTSIPHAPIGCGSKMIRAPFNQTLRYEASGVNVPLLSLSGRIHIY